MTKLSNCTVQAVSDFISSQEKSFSDVHMALAKTNESMARSADKHRRDVQFHSGDLVYVNTAHFSLAPGLSRKLAPKWVGPFPIEQIISSVAYRISLPEEYGHIHPVFHVSSLRGHHGPPPSRPPPIFPVADSSQPEYEVEDILAQRIHRGKTQYLVKWLGYPVFESTWEPVEHLANAPDIVRKFLARIGSQ